MKTILNNTDQKIACNRIKDEKRVRRKKERKKELEEKGCGMNWKRKDVEWTEEKGCRMNWKRKDEG